MKKSRVVSPVGLYAVAYIMGLSVDCLVDTCTGGTLTLISGKVWKTIQDGHKLSSFDAPVVSAHWE